MRHASMRYASMRESVKALKKMLREKVAGNISQ
jgi:hypothetical protein